MNIVIAKNDLLSLLSRVVGCADVKSTLPALKCALLTAQDGRLTVAATDLYLAVSTSAEAEIKKPGAIAVDAKGLLERVKAMPSGPVAITTDANHVVTLKAVASARRYTLRGLPSEDYPGIATPDEKAQTLTIPASTLGALIRRVSPAISTDETRAALNSMLLSCDGGKVTTVATDGHRLTVATETLADGGDLAQVLIPLKGANELKRLVESVAKDNPTLTVSVSGPTTFVAAGNTTLSIKTVDAQFPPWQQVVPAASKAPLKCARAALADAIRAVSLAASDRTGGVVLEFATDSLRITSESPDGGDGFDELACDYDGAKVRIGANGKYLLDVLGAVDCNEVVVSVGSDLDPIRFDCVGEDGFTAVVMPMRCG